MLNSVSVRNWQSLRAVDLDLGRFTVIVGASSSGKSALIRALRALASNATGNSAITRGATSAAITVKSPTGSVTLEYSRGAWRYRLLQGGREAEYSKLHRAVPEPITAALRIDPVPTGGASLNFAGQFDRPFLLTDSGATVARQLGELTNVDTIFEAVRQANRRKTTLAATLRTRRDDLARVSTDAEKFRDLPARLTGCTRAEQLAEKAAALADRVRRLSAAIDTVEVAESVLARAADLPAVPDLGPVARAEQRLSRFRQLLRELINADAAVRQHDQGWHDTVAVEHNLQIEYQQTLSALGTCPTCGQTVTP